MPNSIFGIFFVLGLLGLGVVAALGYGAHLYSISELTNGTFGGRLQTYSNIDLGLSIRYPSDFTVNPEYTYVGIGRDKQIRGIAFVVPYEKTKGTNLASDTHLSIEVIPNQPSCSAGLFLSAPKGAHAVVERDVSYTVASNEQNGSAGHRYEEVVYALPTASPCVAVRYFIHTTNNGDYISAAVLPFDRKSLLSVFDTMRHSLSVKR